MSSAKEVCMRPLSKGYAALAILMAVAVGGMVVTEYAWASRGKDHGGRCGCSEREGGWNRHGHGERALSKALGLSKEQKDQIKTLFRKNHEEMAPLRKEIVSERRDMRNLILSDKPDEAAIREQAKKIAATTGEIAVRRAKATQEVRALLTPEQIEKFKALQEKRDRRIDRVMERREERHK
jgi:protein CpxP